MVPWMTTAARDEQSTRRSTIMFTPGHVFAFAKPTTAGKGRLRIDSSKHGRLRAHAEQEGQQCRGEKITKVCAAGSRYAWTSCVASVLNVSQPDSIQDVVE